MLWQSEKGVVAFCAPSPPFSLINLGILDVTWFLLPPLESYSIIFNIKLILCSLL